MPPAAYLLMYIIIKVFIWDNKSVLEEKKDIKSVVVNKQESVYDTYELNMTFNTLEFWTPELIEWIGNENDPIKLACTSHLLNCHQWPKYLPSKPNNYEDWTQNEYFELRQYFVVQLLEMLNEKAEVLSPKLSKKIWITGFYNTWYEKL